MISKFIVLETLQNRKEARSRTSTTRRDLIEPTSSRDSDCPLNQPIECSHFADYIQIMLVINKGWRQLMKRFKIWIFPVLIAIPVMAVTLQNIANATTEPQVAAGEAHVVVLKSDGTVVAQGANSHGQCNVGDWSDIVQVSAGRTHTVGLKADGTVVARGSNSSGECNVSSWSDITQISAGNFLTVGLKSDGTAVATGLNHKGQCNVSGWSDMIQVSAGGTHTVGLKSDGTVVTAGDNYWGQRNVTGWSNIVQVAASYSHTVGLKSNGAAVAVGFNDDGRCDVDGWNWNGIVKIASSGAHTAALKSDGKVIATGSWSAGQLEVSDWSNIDQIATGYATTLGLKKNGTNVDVLISGRVDSFVWTVEPTSEQRYAAGYDAGHQVGYNQGYNTGHQAGYDQGYDAGNQAGYNQGYQTATNYYTPIISDLQEQIEGLIATYADNAPPTGSVHVYANTLWPPNNKMVEVTISGFVCDELSIARDGGGVGVSEAYLLVNGEETIDLLPELDVDGSFSILMDFRAVKGAIYTIELYAADTNPGDNGGLNSGLVDETYISVPSDVGK